MANLPDRNLSPAPETVNTLRPELRASAAVVEVNLRAAARLFLLAGRELRAAKAECRHGEWGQFLQALKLPASTARALMRAAKAVDDGLVPEGRSLRATLAALADERAKRQRVAGLPATAEPHPLSIEPHLKMPAWDSDGRPPLEPGECSTCTCFAGTYLEQWARHLAGRGPDPTICPVRAERVKALYGP